MDFYKNPRELIYAISNEMIPDFKDIRKDYTNYISARLGYSKKFIDRKSMEYSKKNYESVKNTNQY